MRVVCAMSGGVDSSFAAALLLAAGHEVIGLTMRLYDASEDERKGRGGTCCSPAEVDMARRACAELGIPHYVVDERERFARAVIEPFARDYAAGRTPNPCTRCNQQVKFEPILRRARALGARAMATGHYARNEFGYALRRGVDPKKDQSYFLFAMGRSALRATWFPLGTWTKDAVRERARAMGLPNWDAPDSQELCFVPGGDHGAIVERTLATQGLSTETLGPGLVVDEAGEVVGEHRGIHRVTIGQRRGFEVRGNEKRYVLQVLPATRTVVVGDESATQCDSLLVSDFQFLMDPARLPPRLRGYVQVRHQAIPTAADLELVEPRRVRIRFDSPIRAAAPGQAAVVYDDEDRVIGGGWIDETARTGH